MLQLDVVLFGEKLKHGRKDGFEHIFHKLGTKAINGTKVWALPSRKPHEHDVLAYSLCSLARRVDALCESINEDFHEHYGVLAVPGENQNEAGRMILKKRQRPPL
ncbi:hypothetical protein FHS18_003547 [Paenibacillus phyllosphaerae]|uniref:Uncharacterized protein n=1 Tax=Paenibacillus phyllosphaerae TaxID=274593 RepID=A0A7W5FNY1_9BACL|nr:hypothetical protein [Paenibacillus phyllosphaerae]